MSESSGLPPRTLGQRLRAPLMLGVPVLVLAIAGFAWLGGGRYEATDDAYVQAARVQVSSNIPGRVIEVNVHENQLVKKGEVLFKLDPQPLETAIAQSEAQTAQARLQVESLRATYRQRQADTKAAEDQLDYQKHELARQRTLAQGGVSSQAQVDQAKNAMDAADQHLAAARQGEAAALAALGGSPEGAVDAHPSVRAAQAALSRDRLNRSYGVITAAQDGIVTKVEQLQTGNYVNAAQPLFALVSPRVWIDANLKEDQLGHLRAGQPATVKVDAREGFTYHGKVASLSPGTGSSFSLLPPENATGNWVKVVQRLPVRIELDEAELREHPLQAGLSAKVTIDTGHRRSLFGESEAKPATRP
jgi:membrane fusion protein (multidrug efflux system)